MSGISKSDISKPNIYIANVQGPENDPLDVARAIEHNPFINSIYTLEAVYSAELIAYAPDQVLQDISVRAEVELQMADIFIMDLRNGDPVEIGYALARSKPIVLFNPEDSKVNPLIYGDVVFEANTYEELADLNYLKILLNADSNAR